jgi:RNA polymerase sigma-70 factor (ECF subfamily)
LPQKETVPDDRLRLIFICCHPALNQPAQVALTLRLLDGLKTPEIARAFLPRSSNGARARTPKASPPTRCPGEGSAPATEERPQPGKRDRLRH